MENRLSSPSVVPRHFLPHPHPQVTRGRWEGMTIAIPFLVCFSIFGILNLIGGTILTVLACRPRLTPRALNFMQELFRSANMQLPSQLDPMQVVGIMLLVTGALLVVIGVALGVIACRSVTQQQRRRERLALELSGLQPLCFEKSTSGRFTSSFCSSTRRNGGKRLLEKTVSPILEENSEDEKEARRGSGCVKADIETFGGEKDSDQTASARPSRELVATMETFRNKQSDEKSSSEVELIV